MKKIYSYPHKRIIKVSDSGWLKLAVVKTFFPPDKTVKLAGKEVKIKDVEIENPKEQTKLDL